MHRLIELALDFLFPPVCGICGQLGDKYICEKCMREIKTIEKNGHIKVNNEDYSEQFWLFEYKDLIRNLILRYKFNEQSFLYRTFVEIIIHNEKAVKYIKNADYIVPVPIHKSRYKERGYNQCALIAKELSNQIQNIDFLPKLLYKDKKTSPQSTLDKDERINNVKGVFSIKNERQEHQGKSIILLDDIYTTGNTVRACAFQLKRAGFDKIKVITIAKD